MKKVLKWLWKLSAKERARSGSNFGVDYNEADWQWTLIPYLPAMMVLKVQKLCCGCCSVSGKEVETLNAGEERCDRTGSDPFLR